jgi:hypothetical protein
MLTIRQKGCLRKCPEKKSKERTYRFKGGLEVSLPKSYSLRKRGKFIDLFHGRKRISFFGEDVVAETIVGVLKIFLETL